MKKAIPYIAGVLLLLLLAALLLGDKKQQFDHRITLNKKDKIPYGSFVAYNNLQHIFPKANITTNKREPGYWDYGTLDPDSTGQVLVIVTRNFNAFSSELRELHRFVSNGNDVLVSAYNFSYEAAEFFHFQVHTTDIGIPVYDFSPAVDTLKLTLSDPPFSRGNNEFQYPGRRYNSDFQRFDSTMSYVLGRTGGNRANCLKIQAGEGNFLLHGAPLAFSNYFLLHQDNMAYYNQLMSALNPEATAVVWDEYYLYKTTSYRDPNPSPFRVLLEQPSFKMALYTALAGTLLFILLGLKRNQRVFRQVGVPANDSMDFVKTIGRLYYQKNDNANIARKMAGFFIEHVHNRYFLHADSLDETYTEQLSRKSGAEKQLIQSIVDYLVMTREGNQFTNEQTAAFYGLLEQFYTTT